jgi:hypothetical protein
LLADPSIYPRHDSCEHVHLIAQAVHFLAQAGYLGEDALVLAGEMVKVDGLGHGMTLSDHRLQRLDLGVARHRGSGQRITSNPHLTFRISVIGAALHRARFARAFNAPLL